jgi:hypothetical protein
LEAGRRYAIDSMDGHLTKTRNGKKGTDTSDGSVLCLFLGGTVTVGSTGFEVPMDICQKPVSG